ncbi:UNVERIFIED_CONTAM: hypothetical protein PYX00_003133 [Menopon gallinae]|uniref:Uncharacterized protein n=1 Tax=Menopon gallinae TaxID=328185 RepID=A0AAW2HZJ9_9NEOP
MRPATYFCWILAILAIATASPARETGLPKRKSAGKEDLSADGTDYAKQFGIHHLQGPVYGGYYRPQEYNQWVPYQPGYRERPSVPIDPYVLQLVTRYVRYLPQGLGLYGIYGSTGLPRPKPPGVFRFTDKDK